MVDDVIYTELTRRLIIWDTRVVLFDPQHGSVTDSSKSTYVSSTDHPAITVLVAIYDLHI